MASRRPLDYPVFQAFDANGNPLSGGTVEFFDAGTTDQRNTYSDPELTTANPNPVTLNSRGEPESGGGSPINIYLDNQPYKMVLKDSSGSTIRTVDDYIGSSPTTIPQDPADASIQTTDDYEAVLSRDPENDEVFTVDFQSVNTTTTPTFENTNGSLGALTIKTKDGSPLWPGALNGVHELQYDGTNYLVTNPESTKGTVDPEHATDSATDTYVSATNTTVPGNGVSITRDFQSANTTATPTLDGKTMTTRDGSSLWAGAVSGFHDLQRNEAADTYLVLEPRPSVQNNANSPVARDSGGRALVADPTTVGSHAVNKRYLDAGLVLDGASGGSQGNGTINTKGYFAGGIKLGGRIFDNPGSDVTLEVGDTLILDKVDSNSARIPVTMVAGAHYRISASTNDGETSDNAIILKPNDSNFTDDFHRETIQTDNGTVAGTSTTTDDNFRMGDFANFVTLRIDCYNEAQGKRKKVLANSGGDRATGKMVQSHYIEWTNTADSWNTLGTLQWLNSAAANWFVSVERVK